MEAGNKKRSHIKGKVVFYYHKRIRKHIGTYICIFHHDIMSHWSIYIANVYLHAIII